jgi:post-segregation antitoxin (ccd killing protein)
LAKTPVELPGDLVEQALAYGIPVAEVAERALRNAVAAAKAREEAPAVIREAADRAAERFARGPGSPAHGELPAGRARSPLPQVVLDVLLQGRPPSPADVARSYGISWARDEAATLEELRYVAEYAGPVAEFRAPDSLRNVLAPKEIEVAYQYRAHPGRSDWQYFQGAVRQVWKAMPPLL